MTTQNKLLALGALLFVFPLYLGLRQDKIEERAAAASGAPEAAARAEPSAKPAASGAIVTSPAEPVDPELIAHLRSRYGANIRDPYVQIRLIEALMRHFQSHDFLRWRRELLRAVRAGFPERYDEIVSNLDRRVEYGRWMEENQASLNAMEPETRRAAIREERERLFGQGAADEIWASERKNQAVSDTLKEIDGLEGTSIDEKLSTYTERLEEIYEESYESHLERHRHDAMNRFLSLDSVQADLTGMSAEERSAALRDIRKAMGLDEAALERWDALDQARDSRWEKGKEYMAERAALSGLYSGRELEEKLTELRQGYFGTGADVIAAEEASGLYRFGGPRKWGQN